MQPIFSTTLGNQLQCLDAGGTAQWLFRDKRLFTESRCRFFPFFAMLDLHFQLESRRDINRLDMGFLRNPYSLRDELFHLDGKKLYHTVVMRGLIWYEI